MSGAIAVEGQVDVAPTGPVVAKVGRVFNLRLPSSPGLLLVVSCGDVLISCSVPGRRRPGIDYPAPTRPADVASAMNDDRYDVAIVGAGPAGATAGMLLAQRGHRVALVDRSALPREAVSAGWLNSAAVGLLEALHVPAGDVLAHALGAVTFHNADFSKSATPRFRNPPGYLIERRTFDDALVNNAVRSGAKWIVGEAVDVRLKEASVRLELGGERAVESRLLLLATGRESTLPARIGLVRDSGRLGMWSAQVDARPPNGACTGESRLSVILGMERGGFGLCCAWGRGLSVGVHLRGQQDQVIPALVELCRLAYRHEVVPIDLSGRAASATVLSSPAAAALDMETHVGKHTLLIGDAGGFVSAAANEGLYPGMWSGRIAAEVLDRALGGVYSQDELMTFDSQWRVEMADYLRPPHTDIHFLLPLVFSKQPMADRMAGAFFSGENI